MYSIKQFARQVFHSSSHLIGKISGHYYFEDYVRVYPDQLAFNRLGVKKEAGNNDVNNYLNHRKFYYFAGQFVNKKAVADVGCGSGYGCEILKQHGASLVFGCDISKNAIGFARNKFNSVADFVVQGITNLHAYENSRFDVTISSEVLEHIKEYNMEHKALMELKRITRNRGVLIIGTPNSELLNNHGYTFDEIKSLFSSHFNEFCIFENALVPFGDRKQAWKKRLAEGNTGIVISENINLKETCLADNANPELKIGLEAGKFKFNDLDIDTTLLHNTHSWIVVAIK